MALDAPPIAIPAMGEWELVAHGPRRRGTDRAPIEPERRRYYQSELTIDGEIALVALAAQAIEYLQAQGYPIRDLTEVIGDDGAVNWDKATPALMHILRVLPRLAAESVAIMFGYLPFDEAGHRDPDWDDEVTFIRHAITVSRWIAAWQLFAAQNDIERLTGPFVTTLQKAVQAGIAMESLRTATTSRPS